MDNIEIANASVFDCGKNDGMVKKSNLMILWMKKKLIFFWIIKRIILPLQSKYEH
jgi:hypothetical protein